LRMVALAVVLTLLPGAAHAELTRVEISARRSYLDGRQFSASGKYEELVGTAHFEVDPRQAANRGVVDLDQAPRNARGKVECVADSRYPRIADGTLVPVTGLRWPSLPGIARPHSESPQQAYRVDYGPQWKQGIMTIEPPRVGKPFPILVPQVDADGNELAGIKMPEVSVPLATFTGWNWRNQRIGAPHELSDMQGMFLPFARNKAQRGADPRASIEERYTSREQYLGRIGEAIARLTREGYLLPDDAGSITKRAGEVWDRVTAG